MDNRIAESVKEVIISSVAANLSPAELNDEFKLAGNLLDSMAVTNLILGLEEYFGFTFNDDELVAEAFETVSSLTEFIQKKLGK